MKTLTKSSSFIRKVTFSKVSLFSLLKNEKEAFEPSEIIRSDLDFLYEFFSCIFFFFCRWRQSCGVWWPSCPPSSLIPPFSGSLAELSELNSLPYQYSTLKIGNPKWKFFLGQYILQKMKSRVADPCALYVYGSRSGSCISKKFCIWIMRFRMPHSY